MIKIGVECTKCFKYFRINVKTEKINCTYCHEKLGIINAIWKYNDPCPICNKDSYYKRKDFNQIIGFLIIVLGAYLAITIHYYYLAIVLLIDLILIRFIPEIGVCYNCSTEFINVDDTRSLDVFNHHIGDLYDQK